MAPGARVAKIPIDTLIMNREALLKMYGPTLSALVSLDEADLDVNQAAASTKSASAPQKKKITKSNTKDKKIVALPL